MLEKVILHNFKSHKHTELSFDSSRLHGLVGKNSAGKTTVLQALHNLSRLADSSFAKIFQYERSPQFITTIGEKDISVTASGFWGYSNRQYWQASYSWKHENNDSWYPTASWNIDGRPGKSPGWLSSLTRISHKL